MTTSVFLAVMLAAFTHASWNALLKVRLDRFASISLMSFGSAIVALPVLPFVAVPEGITWFWLCVSVCFHTGYKYFLTRAYETGDMSLAYPLARGTAPLLTTLGAVILVQEIPGAIGIAGIVLLCAGVFLMSFRGGVGVAGVARHSIFYALLTSVFIAGYSLSDGSGARSAVNATSYAAWLFLLEGVWSLIFCIWLRGRRVIRIMLPEWKIGLVGGLLSAFGYWVAMWAMTKAPIATVAALRETSILFAMVISATILGESVTRWRVMAAVLIVGGVAALRLA